MSKQAIAHRTDGGWRRVALLAGFASLAICLMARASYLQVFNHEFYRSQGEARQLRSVAISAHRGDLVDRAGEPLAVSTPIESLWGVPDSLIKQPRGMELLAANLALDAEVLKKRIAKAAERDREFVYLKRHVLPERVERVMQLQLEDVYVQKEYRRYYPSGSAASHLIGFTDIDDRGSEGLEMAYDNWLSGSPGLRRVIRDRAGREISGMGVIKPAIAGKDLKLSIDRQLQYFADKALRDSIETHKAESGSAIIMAVQSGEILAMVNFPGYNPNNRSDRRGGKQRNRSITDVFEPGSTMKPFTVAAALETDELSTETTINTSPGRYQIGRYEISDLKDHGILDLSGIVTKSSNVGISKLAQRIPPENMWSVFDAFGFGRPVGSEFPGEVAGYFNHSSAWHRSEQASVSFGYGVSVSALQLVRAYAAIANDGVMPPISFLADAEEQSGHRVIDASIAEEVGRMLESVVTEGSGTRAQVPGYRVAGKTGTSHQSQLGGYSEDRYISLFAGYAPASDPKLASVVVIHDPQAGQYFGGVVAAPVFAEIMAHALRLGNIEPDNFEAARSELLPAPKPAAARLPDKQSIGDRS
ncbi:MAG: penicillin-binding protein 2 [Granulosicoccus sp.]|nr:penicillin-binding protein 2 [Granulosicoccus sp.]